MHGPSPTSNLGGRPPSPPRSPRGRAWGAQEADILFQISALVGFEPRTSQSNRNRNHNLKTSKALLKSQARQGTSLFTSAATNKGGFQRRSREAQVRFPEYQEGIE